jgi:hypothetical protein
VEERITIYVNSPDSNPFGNFFVLAVSFHTFGGEKGERKERRKVLATRAA